MSGVVGLGVDYEIKEAKSARQLGEGSNLPYASIFFGKIEVKSQLAKPTLETRLCL